MGFPGSSAGKESASSAEDPGSTPGPGRSPWRRDRPPTLVFLDFPGGSDGKESPSSAGDTGLIPGESCRQRSLAGATVRWGHKESETKERLSTSTKRIAR